MLFFYLSVVTFLVGVGIDAYRITKRNNQGIMRRLNLLYASVAMRALTCAFTFFAFAIGFDWKISLSLFGASTVLLLIGAVAINELTNKLSEMD